MEAHFDANRVELELDPREYSFVYLTLSYVMDGISMADHDFRNILGMSREQAEAMFDGLIQAERAARHAGTHWSPRTAE